MRIVCWQTILMKYLALFFSKLMRYRKIGRLLQSRLALKRLNYYLSIEYPDSIIFDHLLSYFVTPAIASS